MNEEKYDQLKRCLTNGRYRDGASKYVLRRMAENFQYDPVKTVIYHVDKKDRKKDSYTRRR